LCDPVISTRTRMRDADMRWAATHGREQLEGIQRDRILVRQQLPRPRQELREHQLLQRRPRPSAERASAAAPCPTARHPSISHAQREREREREREEREREERERDDGDSDPAQHAPRSRIEAAGWVVYAEPQRRHAPAGSGSSPSAPSTCATPGRQAAGTPTSAAPRAQLRPTFRGLATVGPARGRPQIRYASVSLRSGLCQRLCASDSPGVAPRARQPLAGRRAAGGARRRRGCRRAASACGSGCRRPWRWRGQPAAAPGRGTAPQLRAPPPSARPDRPTIAGVSSLSGHP
jgi:hypothetical protein